MASWRKHFKIWNPEEEKTNAGSRVPGSASKFSSWLQDVYTGQPNRVERYTQYDQMDQDSEINAALDTIAEFCTQADIDSNLPFNVRWNEDPSDSETNIINESLRKWCTINKFPQRIFRIFRNSIKYGDHFFLRDPETFELYWVSPTDVKRAVINEASGRAIEQYVITNVHPNFAAKVATDPIDNVQSLTTTKGPASYAGVPSTSKANSGVGTEIAVDSEHIIHISLNEGLDSSWPFGGSILDSVFKIFKQKELLEDAIIIYRVQRAPERRVFYIDTGNLPSHQAMAFVERVKNEIHQRRIPTRNGGGTVMDSTYNPLSILEDFFFAQQADGRGSKVEVLPGGQNLGEIDDLKFFTNKLVRGLRIPSSYLPTGGDDSPSTFTDGRMGVALIQEYRFNRYCQRLQSLIMPFIDKEFKIFLKHRGININSSDFEINLLEPQNFSDYRDIEVNNARAAVFAQVSEIPYLSHRFKLQKFLGLSQEEISENEKLWNEENNEPAAATTDETLNTSPGSGLKKFGAPMPTEDDLFQTSGIGNIAPDQPEDGAAPDEGTGLPNKI